MRSTSSEITFPVHRYFWSQPGGHSEKELEALLKEETRKLPMPSGEWKPFTHLKLTWDTMDFLMIMAQGKYSRVMLVDLALKQSAQNGKAFIECFADVCAYHADLLDRTLRSHSANSPRRSSKVARGDLVLLIILLLSQQLGRSILNRGSSDAYGQARRRMCTPSLP